MDNLKKQGVILDHWDMWSSRNLAHVNQLRHPILDHWDMWSSRNPENLVSISRQF